MSAYDVRSKSDDDTKEDNVDVKVKRNGDNDDDDIKSRDDDAGSNKLYECLGDALDAMDEGVEVDHAHLRDLARKSVGPFESQLSFETEDGKPICIDVPCEKNPGHESFFPVSDFKPENIPVQHRTKRFYDTILAWANLVVRIVVKRVSRNRPEVYSDTKFPFPDSGKKVRGSTRKIRYGSGYVVSGFDTNQPYKGQFCPCHLCRDSDQRREFWSLNIATVTHVVYDSSEARDCVFEFFYDTEDKKTVDFMYGTDSFEQVGKNTEKICIVRCVTHDRRLFKRLFKLLTLCQSMSIASEELKFENDPVVMISHPHGKCKCVSFGRVIDFRVPSNNDFPVNRPITFTRAAECRLPLYPWLGDLTDKKQLNPTNSNDDDMENSQSIQTSSRQNFNNSTPLPTPITMPSDVESYLEAHGGFVINTGKNQNILSPGMFKRESDNPSSMSQLKNQNTEQKSERTTIHESPGEFSGYNLDNFFASCNFRCVNVDNNNMYTLEDIYFGNPQQPRDMRLEGLVKSPNDPEPHVPVRMDVQSVERMYRHFEAKDEFDSSTTDVELHDTAQSFSDNSKDGTVPKISNVDDHVSSSCVTTICTETEGVTIHPDEKFDNIGQTYNRASNNDLKVGSNTIERESSEEHSSLCPLPGGNKYNDETNDAFVENESCDTTHPKNDNNLSNENIKSLDISTSDREKSCSVERIMNDKESSLPKLNDPGAQRENSLDKSCEIENVAFEVKETETLDSKPNEKEYDACSGAAADLSIPEMLQILIDKGVDLFPENSDENMSGVDELIQLVSAIRHVDGLPLLSVLNKIYENVATKNKTSLILEPGTQFNLPEGMTFTLPQNSSFALRFHDLNSSWFSFPLGTTFHVSEGQRIEIPDDAEFSFKHQAILQGFLTYKLDSCPGSSGGLVLLGKGMWQVANFSHSGIFNDKKRVNRSSLRRWMIYLN